MNKIFLLSIFLFIFLSCEPKEVTSPKETLPALTKEKQDSPSISVKTWENNWNEVIAGAKREGKVVVYIGAGGEIRDAIVKSFKQKYGIEVEAESGRSTEFTPKVKAQRKANVFTYDVFQSGVGPAILTLKPEGSLDPIEPALILPEVIDPKAWWRGKIPFVDREQMAVGFLAYPYASLVVNSNLVRPEEIRSYDDLLNPKWKGKMLLSDPTGIGVGGNMVGVLGGNLMGYDFLRKLAQQEPIIMRDQRLQTEWVAAGKYPIIISPNTTMVAEFANVGAPLRGITPKEGTDVTTGLGSLSLFNRSPHPNAARLYINWLLSREGQTLITKIGLTQSARVDIPTDFLPPETIRQPGVNYIDTSSEEFILKRVEYNRIAQEIFGHLMK